MESASFDWLVRRACISLRSTMFNQSVSLSIKILWLILYVELRTEILSDGEAGLLSSFLYRCRHRFPRRYIWKPSFAELEVQNRDFYYTSCGGRCGKQSLASLNFLLSYVVTLCTESLCERGHKEVPPQIYIILFQLGISVYSTAVWNWNWWEKVVAEDILQVVSLLTLILSQISAVGPGLVLYLSQCEVSFIHSGHWIQQILSLISKGMLVSKGLQKLVAF